MVPPTRRSSGSHVEQRDLPDHDGGGGVIVARLLGLLVDPAVAQTAGHHKQRAHIHLAGAPAPLVVGGVVEHVVQGAVLGAVLQRALGGRQGTAGGGGQGVLEGHGGAARLAQPHAASRSGLMLLLLALLCVRVGRGRCRGARGSVTHRRSHGEELHWAVVSVQGHHPST